MSKYAIAFTKKNIDLITILISGAGTLIEDDQHYFIFDTQTPRKTVIKSMNDLLDRDGHLIEPLIFLD